MRSQTETEEVVAAVARDFYPEYMVDADGRPGGFGIDLINEVAKRAGALTMRVRNLVRPMAASSAGPVGNKLNGLA